MATVAAAAAFCYWENNAIVSTHYLCKTKLIPNGKKIRLLQLSDLQNKMFGKDHQALIRKIHDASPDVILITGDLTDRRRTELLPIASLAEKLQKEAKAIYYVSGNHEHQSEVYEDLTELLYDSGIIILDNACSYFQHDDIRIAFLGLRDKSANPYFRCALETLTKGISKDTLSILLSHRPELFDCYASYPIDLVFTGHAHGGQIRLPGIGGLFAPHQGFFPPYTAGVHRSNGTSMIISRGLGDSSFPLRLFNRPELVVMDIIGDNNAVQSKISMV